MKLTCNFCKHKAKTDKLYLVNVGGRDYLLCTRHKEKHELNTNSKKG